MEQSGGQTGRRDDLQVLRERIDDLDRELLVLLNQRAKASLDVARLKDERGLSRLDEQREDQLIAGLKAANSGPLTDEDIRVIYQLLLERFRSLPLDASLDPSLESSLDQSGAPSFEDRGQEVE